MRVLILNRRDILNPLGGGAERFTFEIAKAMLQNNISVDWFSSRFKNSKSEEIFEGIRIIRKGNEFFVHFFGLIYVLRNYKTYDLVIDEFNGIGFFTFFLKKSILIIHQLYQEFWIYEMGKFFSFMKFVEKFFLKLYKNKKTITVSKSTYDELKKLGFNDIEIISNGIDLVNIECKKSQELKLCFLGRLRRTKNPEDAIRIFLKVKEIYKDVQMVIIGTGPLENYLRNKYSKIENLYFLGYLDERKKLEELCKCHFLIVPSIREGWGIVVIEANMVFVPVIGYDVPGLRDSIKNGINGFLVKNVEEAVNRIIEIWNKKEVYESLCISSWEYALNFSWSKTREKFINFLLNYYFPKVSQ
ncbi:MAG: glycosyltransferase family 4 protein [candidate division WOR-3 bacterium]|nr:glycosyltransferase family 4 protein [candidate division WOR-3 bacterium]MCX7947523.1 glycosyltransferase family 4 protein [candidate division WOR-3 bacterium]MDW8150409.1 glycosyltransferase family 4 protein [candidate division WOR-3 bacterium]